MGDPNGIGLETIIKCFNDSRMIDFCVPIVFGSAKIAQFHRKGNFFKVILHFILLIILMR